MDSAPLIVQLLLLVSFFFTVSTAEQPDHLEAEALIPVPPRDHDESPAGSPSHHHHHPNPHHHHHHLAPTPTPAHAPTPHPHPHHHPHHAHAPSPHVPTVHPPAHAPSHPPSHLPVQPPSHMPAHPPSHMPAHPPSHMPVHPPLSRSFIAVQGVVYCKSCKYPGVDTLLGASPLLGAVMKLECNNTKYRPVMQTAKTDKNGYFFLRAPKTITTYAFHKCAVSLASSPLPTCQKPSRIGGGLSGAPLKPEKPIILDKLPYVLFTVGPFAFEPKCPRHN